MIRKALTAIIAAVSLNCCAPESEYVSQEQQPVEQIFRDHDGYRTYFTDKDKTLQERIYYTERNSECPIFLFPSLKDLPANIKFKFIKIDRSGYDENPVTIIKDLEPGTRGYATILNYKVNSFEWGGPHQCAHVEIHMPADQKLSPGNGCTGGKLPEYPPMGEIR